MATNHRQSVTRLMGAVLLAAVFGLPSQATAGPQGWTSADVGLIAYGTAVEQNGVWTIQGGGAD